MKRIIVAVFAGFLFVSNVCAEDTGPVSYHLTFDNLDFLSEDWVQQTGLKTIEERKWELVDGHFGMGLYLGAVPLKYDVDNMSGLDLDLVTAVIFNVGIVKSKGRGYDEPFIWGAGKLHPGYGAVAFWVKGSSQPETPDTRTVLFEQTTTTWGRKERELLQVELLRDRTITAYVEDARYVQHTIQSGKVWKENSWNHVVFIWDRASGLSLWVNGREAASSMGSDAWWENQRPGLFHFPMARAIYDEFYCFARPLTADEIKELYRKNTHPEGSSRLLKPDVQSLECLKNAFTTDSSSLPPVKPSNGRTLVFKEITPERIHDEGIQGWWISDGRYELAWPHEYSVFTIIPGDVDFHAEKADILPPRSEKINYITFEGNLDGVTVLQGDRNGNFKPTPVISVPETEGFFYGTTVQDITDAGIRIPFTRSYGAPPGFKSDGDVLRLPLSGDLRLHEVGVFNVHEDDLDPLPGDRVLYVDANPVKLNDSRYPLALKALFAERDRNIAGIFQSSPGDKGESIDIEPMGRVHLMSKSIVGKVAYNSVIVDLWLTSPSEGNVLQFRLRNPAVPSQTWTHAEMTLHGFKGEPSRLSIAIVFDPLVLVSGDRVWLELLAVDGLTIITGDPERPSTVTLRTEVDWAEAEQKFSIKTMRPAILTYGRSFEYIPWEWDRRMPDVDAPENFGGMFDMAYPWQAVLKVNPGDRPAHIYKAYASSELSRGKYPVDMSKVPQKKFNAPSNAPGWAVYFREFQTFRERIVTWWRHHQRSDGQAGGGWNDDTLLFSRALADMPLDSNADALMLFNNVFDGFDKTNYFKDGYCRIYPIDRLHNGDFVRERYKSLIYNIGDPRSAVWAMEEAWHWGKPEKTPVNYGNGKAFLFGKDVLDWYWGRYRYEEPFRPGSSDSITEELRKAAVVCNDTTLWRFTEAWVHTDDQHPYGASNLLNILLGGWSSGKTREDSNVNITVGVGWIEGGGPQLARLVEYSGNDGLKVSMYSFDEFDRRVTARLFRLDAGIYNVTLRADSDSDGNYENPVSENEQILNRFGRLELTVPPKVPVVLEITRIKADQFHGDLPDLATSNYYIKKQGNTLVVTVHNIGCAPSGAFTVSVLDSRGKELAVQRVDSLSGAGDYVPKKVDVTFAGLPVQPLYRIQIDSEDRVREIFEENNTVVFLPGGIKYLK
ncbi:LamG-like jellyroll fold domain-containing protein [Candidatus Latescibacterota bacterium]